MQLARLLPSMPPLRSALLAALAGGVFGLLLFLLAWSRLDTPDDAAVQPAAITDVAAPGAALPRPDLNPATGGAAPALQAADVAAPVPRAPTPPPPAPGSGTAATDAPAAGTAVGAATPMANPSVPQALERVAPQYPADAMRNGERGTVVVRITVGTDGAPSTVAVERSSRSRDLDRAALDAARRWRFRPAEVAGQPTQADVLVPFEFVPPR